MIQDRCDSKALHFIGVGRRRQMRDELERKRWELEING